MGESAEMMMKENRIPETEAIRTRLFAMQDTAYRRFHTALIPTVDPEAVIGVRTPALRKYARELFGTAEAEAFLRTLPHRYYEENNLHGFLIEKIRDFDTVLAQTERFLPYIDNWATCDMFCPKIFAAHLPELYEKIKFWINASHTYTVRFGIGMLMRFYLDEQFDSAYPSLVADIRSDEYYVNMMIAWYFATALAKRYDQILPYIESHRLDKWTHNKAIQKAIESDRISIDRKAYLRTLKIQ